MPETVPDALPEGLGVGLPLTVVDTVGDVEPEPLGDGEGDDDALCVKDPDTVSVPEGDKLVEPEPE